jgi:hypothetical protein
MQLQVRDESDIGPQTGRLRDDVLSHSLLNMGDFVEVREIRWKWGAGKAFAQSVEVKHGRALGEAILFQP